jgi:hypothetical protein
MKLFTTYHLKSVSAKQSKGQTPYNYKQAYFERNAHRSVTYEPIVGYEFGQRFY